jgi:hypothetical protein
MANCWRNGRLAEQTGMLDLLQGIVDGRQRDAAASLGDFSVELF